VTDPDRSVEASRAVLAHLAVHDFPTRSPLYAAIARAALDDDEVLGLTAGVRGHPRPPEEAYPVFREFVLQRSRTGAPAGPTVPAAP
jgi:hypothetical protein